MPGVKATKVESTETTPNSAGGGGNGGDIKRILAQVARLESKVDAIQRHLTVTDTKVADITKGLARLHDRFGLVSESLEKLGNKVDVVNDSSMKVSAGVNLVTNEMHGVRWWIVGTGIALLAIFLGTGYSQKVTLEKSIAEQTKTLTEQMNTIKTVGTAQTEILKNRLESLQKDSERSWEIANRALERTIPPVQTTQPAQPPIEPTKTK